MSRLNASVNPIVVDNVATPPKTTGTTQVGYDKYTVEELWEIVPGSTWTEVNVHLRTGRGDKADYAGEYPITLAAGQTYRAGIFASGQGPLTTDPVQRADLIVIAVLRRPEARELIIEEDQNTGGTWHRHVVRTNVPTAVALAGASRTPPTFDPDGIPSLVDPAGGLASPTAVGLSHTMDLLPLAPGNHYIFTLMVVDAVGNWEVRGNEFDTLRRKLLVQFPKIHIYNDGDPYAHGSADFGFRVAAGDTSQARNTLQDFHLPEMDIDDWSESDRPYPVGFAYVETEPQAIHPTRANIWISSWATEHDGILESDESAGNLSMNLWLPAGPPERVTNSTFTMDCPPMTDDDFHYGVDVNYTVEYLP